MREPHEMFEAHLTGLEIRPWPEIKAIYEECQ